MLLEIVRCIGSSPWNSWHVKFKPLLPLLEQCNAKVILKVTQTPQSPRREPPLSAAVPVLALVAFEDRCKRAHDLSFEHSGTEWSTIPLCLQTILVCMTSPVGPLLVTWDTRLSSVYITTFAMKLHCIIQKVADIDTIFAIVLSTWSTRFGTEDAVSFWRFVRTS